MAVLIDEKPIASVPDLISIVERDTARPVYVDELNCKKKKKKKKKNID